MARPLIIVADAHIWGVEQAFASLPGHQVELRVVEHADIRPITVKDADILLTRSSTRVDASLLEGSRVRFAATATIGDDHYDKVYLHSRGIAFANAAGSSTGSVIEYMLTALLTLQHQGLLDLRSSTLGIIGVGRIGSRLAEPASRLGLRILLNDPPRARSEGLPGFLSLHELLQQCDVLTLHTPLTLEGPDATHHLIGAPELRCFRGHGIINAARGACVDNAALLDWLREDDRRFAVLDCWENEPLPERQLLSHPGVAIATPHIAGHSLDGKAANTFYVYTALCRWLGVHGDWKPQLPDEAEAVAVACGDDDLDTLHRASRALCPIERDDAAMRPWAGLEDAELRQAFRRYRRHYPARRAWQHAPIRLIGEDATLLTRTRELAHAIGMRCV